MLSETRKLEGGHGLLVIIWGISSGAFLLYFVASENTQKPSLMSSGNVLTASSL